MEIDVVENHACAGIQLTASENGRKPSIVDLHVAQSEVFESNFRISCAGRERVQEAPWALSVSALMGLALLLGPNVDGIPVGVMHFNVLVGDVTYEATSTWSDLLVLVRVIFDVNAFQRVVHFAVSESHVA